MSSYLERVVRFSRVAELGSMTKAAAELNIDQPSLSKQIHQLELTLGFGLFERGGGRLALTEAGAEFLVPARRLADAAGETRYAARRLQRGPDMLRMGVAAYSFWVPARTAIIDEFAVQYPETTLEIVSEPIPILRSQLCEGELDVLFLSHPPDEAALEYLPVHRDRAGLLIPSEDSLADRDELYMADLAGRRLAVAPAPLAPSFYAAYLDAGMVARIIPEGRIAMSYYAARERLCMLTWDSQGREITVPPSLVHRRVVDAPIAAVYGLVRLRGDTRASVGRLWTIAARHAISHVS